MDNDILKILEITPEPRIEYLGFFRDENGNMLIKIKIGDIEEALPWDFKEKLEEILKRKKKVIIGKIEAIYTLKKNEYRISTSQRNFIFPNFRIGSREVEIEGAYSLEYREGEDESISGLFHFLRLDSGTRIKVGEVYGRCFLEKHENVTVIAKNILDSLFLNESRDCYAEVERCVGSYAGFYAKDCIINAKFARNHLFQWSVNCKGNVEVCGDSCGVESSSLEIKVRLFGIDFLRGARHSILIVPSIIDEFKYFLIYWEWVKEVRTIRVESLESVLKRYERAIEFLGKLVNDKIFEKIKMDKKKLIQRLKSEKYDNTLIGYLNELDIEDLKKLRLLSASYIIPWYIGYDSIRKYYERFSEEEIEEMSLLCGLWNLAHSYRTEYRCPLCSVTEGLQEKFGILIDLLREEYRKLDVNVGYYLLLILNSTEYLLKQIEKEKIKRIKDEAIII